MVAGGGFGHNFIRRAHLEVLKEEDLEDQFLSKKMVDIICSPRRLRQQAKLPLSMGSQN